MLISCLLNSLNLHHDLVLIYSVSGLDMNSLDNISIYRKYILEVM